MCPETSFFLYWWLQCFVTKIENVEVETLSDSTEQTFNDFQDVKKFSNSIMSILKSDVHNEGKYAHYF